MAQSDPTTARQIRRLLRRSAAWPTALALALAPAPAFATINNTVTVTATVPGGTTINPTASETVDVQDDTPTITILKAHTLTETNGNTSDGLAEPGDVVSYTYTVTNSGNVTLRNVSVADVHDIAGGTTNLPTVEPTTYTDNQPDGPGAGQSGDSSDATAADGTWDVLGRGDVVVFTGSYTVVQADLNANGGGAVNNDGDIDNTATASGTYDPSGANTLVTASSSDAVGLFIQSGLTITKVADDDTDVVAGQTITYTYTVTNTGNVDVTNITLADTHNGVAGALVPAFQNFTNPPAGSTNTGNTIDILKPGDAGIYTATYVVQQADIDNRQ